MLDVRCSMCDVRCWIYDVRCLTSAPFTFNSESKMKNYRNNGAVGALLDEYEKAVTELRQLLETVTDAELMAVVDPATKDPDCRSIQTILTHVVRAGYTYAIYVRKAQGEELDFRERLPLHSIKEYQKALLIMFRYNEYLFKEYPDLPLEIFEQKGKMLMSWGQYYDIEQLFEHAIVHILRHRRQIERFLIILRAA